MDLESKLSFSNSVKNLFSKVLNSNSSKSLLHSWGFGFSNFSFSSSNSIGTSRIILANSFDSIALSLFSSIAFLIDLLSILSVFSNISSMLSKSCIRSFAFFSPMEGTPGILSELSPQSPSISTTCSGLFTENFSLTSSTPKISNSEPILPGLYISIFSSTNCA